MFVRPPYWRFNSDTRDIYNRHGLHIMLSDAKDYYGVDWGQYIWGRSNCRSQLNAIYRRMQLRDTAAVDDIASIVITSHDNTSEIMRDALRRTVRRTDTAEAEARPREVSLLCQHK
jgi:peptidoglycan/xylan/chitin deacetylase (PgdA/CDA1 family)